MQPPRMRLAPLFDLVCIATFVLVGARHHEVDRGIGWFLEVMWPLCLGFFGLAVLTRIYVRTQGAWLWLAVSLLGGIAIAQVLRGSFQQRPWVSVFTVIALAYLALTMYGWRLVAALLARRRAAPA